MGIPPVRRAVACSYRGCVSTTNISGTDNAFDRCSGTGPLCISTRHFVPGYYRAVPPGQNHSPIEAPRIKSALMGCVSRRSSCGPKRQDSLAQGLPWVTHKNVFSPEAHKALRRCALEKNTRFSRVGGAEGASGVENARMVWIRGQSSPYGNGPFRAHSFGELNPG
jgi:hypothetical protein